MEAKQFVTRAAEFETLQSHVERTNEFSAAPSDARRVDLETRGID